MNLDCYVVGLDGGMTAGAAVALDLQGMPVEWEAWDVPRSYSTTLAVAGAAKRLRMALPGTHPIALCSEAVYIKQHKRRFDSIKAARQFAEKGWVELSSNTGNAALSISRSVGIFIGYFPERWMELPPSEWRKLSGISNMAGSDKKADALELAASRLTAVGTPKAELLRSSILTGNHHLAEAYLVGICGRQIIQIADTHTPRGTTH